MTPITTYYAYAFSAKIWNKPNFQLPNNISCLLVTTQNFDLLSALHQRGQKSFFFICDSRFISFKKFSTTFLNNSVRFDGSGTRFVAFIFIEIPILHMKAKIV